MITVAGCAPEFLKMARTSDLHFVCSSGQSGFLYIRTYQINVNRPGRGRDTGRTDIPPLITVSLQ